MNIAYFLTTKNNTAYIYEKDTLKQGIKKMKEFGYSAVPVLSEDHKYVGTVSEGDFLWYITAQEKDELHRVSLDSLQDMQVGNVLTKEKNPPIDIETSMEELLNRAQNQNFVPVVDDRGIFIGIVTRKDIIQYMCSRK